MITLEIDGQIRSHRAEGTSIMRAAMELGTKIPKLCATDNWQSSAHAGSASSRSKAARARPPPARRRWPLA